MAGLKVAITFSVIGAIVGEFAGALAGLGYVIQFASTQLETPLVFAALVVVSVVGLVFSCIWSKSLSGYWCLGLRNSTPYIKTKEANIVGKGSPS